MKKNARFNNKGFSLVELIIVIAIMAILAGTIVPSVIRYIRKARASSATDEARTIVSAVETGLASSAGNDAEFQIDSTYTSESGDSTSCGLLTNWILSQTQSGTVFEEDNPNYGNYILSKEILSNLQSDGSADYMFFNFNGSDDNPIGMNCAQFANSYRKCPGVIVAYGANGKVVMMQYYNYGCLIHYENGEYTYFEEEESFISSDRLR